MRHARESQGRRARVVVGVSALVAAFTPIAIPVPAAAQLTPADSLQIIQKVVQIRTGWMNRHIHEEVFVVREDPSPSRTWWYVDSVRAFGFVRIRRPWIEGCRGPGVSRTMSDDPPSITRSVYLHNARDRHPDR